ncbi:MAG: hypothetical protein CBC13_08455 [Planctomycetia bacterium TMED53]|nr:MAG: hypothetical protein CBC13_08455 [Planctomycetia bacterium TMED53]
MHSIIRLLSSVWDDLCFGLIYQLWPIFLPKTVIEPVTSVSGIWEIIILIDRKIGDSKKLFTIRRGESLLLLIITVTITSMIIIDIKIKSRSMMVTVLMFGFVKQFTGLSSAKINPSLLILLLMRHMALCGYRINIAGLTKKKSERTKLASLV